jgi:hypothetical protein
MIIRKVARGLKQQLSAPKVALQNTFGYKSSISARDVSPELLRIQGVWPFDFCPDELIVEQKRLIIKRCSFPFTTTIETVPIERLTQFTPTHSLLFSAIYITGWQIDTTVRWLKHDEAQRVKEVVDGLLLQGKEHMAIEEDDRQRVVQALQLLGGHEHYEHFYDVN